MDQAAPNLAADLIQSEEGFVPYAYKDSEGYWTIGIGTLIDERKGGGIELHEALSLLHNRLKKIEVSLDSSVAWWRSLNEVRRAVLLSMAYQMGIRGLLRFVNTLAAMERGDFDTAAAGMLASKWARQTPDRARRAADAMRTGSFQ